MTQMRGSVVVSTSARHAAGRGFGPGTRHVSLLGLNIRDCVSLSFGGDTKNRRSLLSGVYASSRILDSQSSEPGFESSLLSFRRLSIFVLSIDAPVDSAV